MIHTKIPYSKDSLFGAISQIGRKRMPKKIYTFLEIRELSVFVQIMMVMLTFSLTPIPSMFRHWIMDVLTGLFLSSGATALKPDLIRFVETIGWGFYLFPLIVVYTFTEHLIKHLTWECSSEVSHVVYQDLKALEFKEGEIALFKAFMDSLPLTYSLGVAQPTGQSIRWELLYDTHLSKVYKEALAIKSKNDQTELKETNTPEARLAARQELEEKVKSI